MCNAVVFDPVFGVRVCVDTGVVIEENVIADGFEDNLEWVISNSSVAQFYNAMRERFLEAVKLYADGVPVKEILHRTGIRSSSAFYAALGGLRRRPNRRRVRRLNEDEVNKICEEWHAGKSVWEISKETGRARSTVHYVIARMCR